MRAATEMISTLASEDCSTEISSSSYTCHTSRCGSVGPAQARLEPLAPRRWSQLGEPLQRVPGLPRDTVGNLHLDGDDQISRPAVLAGDPLAARPQLAAARRARRHPQ